MTSGLLPTAAPLRLALRTPGYYEFAPFLLLLNRPRRLFSHGAAFSGLGDTKAAAALSVNSVRFGLAGLSDVVACGS